MQAYRQTGRQRETRCRVQCIAASQQTVEMLEMLEADDQRPQADRRSTRRAKGRRRSDVGGCGAVRKLDAMSRAGADEA